MGEMTELYENYPSLQSPTILTSRAAHYDDEFDNESVISGKSDTTHCEIFGLDDIYIESRARNSISGLISSYYQDMSNETTMLKTEQEMIEDLVIKLNEEEEKHREVERDFQLQIKNLKQLLSESLISKENISVELDRIKAESRQQKIDFELEKDRLTHHFIQQIASVESENRKIEAAITKDMKNLIAELNRAKEQIEQLQSQLQAEKGSVLPPSYPYAFELKSADNDFGHVNRIEKVCQLDSDLENNNLSAIRKAEELTIHFCLATKAKEDPASKGASFPFQLVVSHFSFLEKLIEELHLSISASLQNPLASYSANLFPGFKNIFIQDNVPSKLTYLRGFVRSQLLNWQSQRRDFEATNPSYGGENGSCFQHAVLEASRAVRQLLMLMERENAFNESKFSQADSKVSRILASSLVELEGYLA